MTKTALLGFHDELMVRHAERAMRRAGYEATLVGTLDEMLALIERKRYDLYLMDINFRAAPKDITPAEQVYEILRRQERGPMFYGLSGYADVVSRAQEAGIPSADKTYLANILFGKKTV